MRNILLRNLLASSSPEEWGIFWSHFDQGGTLASRIRRRGSYSFVFASASSSASSTTCGGGQVSASRRQAACARYSVLAATERGGACMALRWRIGGADRRLAARPCVASLPPPSRSRLLPPFVTPAPPRVTTNRLDASQSTGRYRLPEQREAQERV